MTMYKLARKLGFVTIPLIVTVGLVGNTLCGLVMFNKDNRRVYCYFYMGMLAVTDSTFLIAQLVYWCINLITKFDLPYEVQQGICSFLWPVIAGRALSGTYIIVAMTFDRLIAVKWPLKSLTWCTMKRARVTTACVIIFCFLLKLPYAWVTKPVQRCVAFRVEKTLLVQTYYWINSAISSYIPFAILLIFNLLIIQTMKKRRKYFQDAKSSDSGSEEMTKAEHKKMAHTKNQQNLESLRMEGK